MYIAEKGDKKYFVDLNYASLEIYGRGKYGGPIWNNPDLIDVTDKEEEDIIKIAQEALERKQKKSVLPEKEYKELNSDKESGLNIFDANIATEKGINLIQDFYKKANRIYVAKTSDSRIAVYEYEGKYYISERRVIISKHHYNAICADGYSKIDEIFKEITIEQIKEIFGEKASAKEIYENRQDCAIEGDATLAFNGSQLAEMQEKPLEKDEESKDGIENGTAEEILKMSINNGITKSEVGDNIFTKLFKRIKEIITRETR